ncbi:hypothetical protein MRB53_037556 [Persea americana]|nr:hypothetical protein MRB53_037556 [Persea americana]
MDGEKSLVATGGWSRVAELAGKAEGTREGLYPMRIPLPDPRESLINGALTIFHRKHSEYDMQICDDSFSSLLLSTETGPDDQIVHGAIPPRLTLDPRADRRWRYQSPPLETCAIPAKSLTVNACPLSVMASFLSRIYSSSSGFFPFSLLLTACEKNDRSNDNEKSDVVDHAHSLSNAHDIDNIPITYRYLTFETVLPVPVRQSHGENGTPPPDLRAYTNPFEWSLDGMTAEWHISRFVALLGITVFTIGFAISPMLIAPLSEINGRRPVFVISGAFFVIAQLCSGLTRIYAGMIVSRILAGASSSVFTTVVAGVVADTYHKEERNARWHISPAQHCSARVLGHWYLDL